MKTIDNAIRCAVACLVFFSLCVCVCVLFDLIDLLEKANKIGKRKALNRSLTSVLLYAAQGIDSMIFVTSMFLTSIGAC